MLILNDDRDLEIPKYCELVGLLDKVSFALILLALNIHVIQSLGLLLTDDLMVPS